MPLVKVEILEGKSKEYKSAILEGIHQALVDSIKIPDHDRRQRLYELSPDCFEHNGWSDNYTIVEVTMFKGRSAEAKKAFFRKVVENLASNPGISGIDITIVINDPGLENWGVRGGIPASEIDFGNSLNV
jgi:Uncharacterized protein, 4-oxalocrotonate tautomerase homolog